MKKLMKRIINALFVIAMMMGLMTITAFAEDSDYSDVYSSVTVTVKWDEAEESDETVYSWCWGDGRLYVNNTTWPGDTMTKIDNATWQITIPITYQEETLGFITSCNLGQTIDLLIPSTGNVLITVDAEPGEYGRYGATVEIDEPKIDGLEWKYEILDDQSVIIQRYFGENTEIDIPAEIDGYSVKRIDSWAFYGNTLLSRVTIPESVTEIGSCAFYCCSNLTCINLPEEITSIGEKTFEGCNSLVTYGYSDSYAESYTKENNIPFVIQDKEQDYGNVLRGGFCGANAVYLLYDSGILVISGNGWTYRNAFHNNKDIKNVIINEGITEIGEEIFFDCSSLKEIKLPSGISSISYGAFSGCSSLTSIELPEGITNIDDYAFHGCSSLTSIELPEGITSIGGAAFSGCINLNSIEVDDNNEFYSSIEGVLYNKDISTLIKCPEGKENINIPDSVTNIGEGAFCSCENLTNVILHEGITNIGEGSFWGCQNLIINCYSGSYAEDYAKENNIQYYLINEEGNDAGWKQDIIGWKYVNEDGTYLMNTWETIDGNKYYFDASGYMVTGWLNYNGNLYYLESSGKLATDKWIDGIYYVKSDGVMATNEWVDNGKYYVDEDGKWIPDKIKDKVTVILKWDKAESEADEKTVYSWCWGDYLNFTESNCWPGDAMIKIDDATWKITISTTEPDNYVGLIACYMKESEYVQTLDLQIPNSGNVFIIVDKEADPDENKYGAVIHKYGILDDQTVTIQKYWGDTADIIIPDEIDGYEVKSISDGAFYGCANIKSVTIPKNITTMGYGIFEECTSLTINCYSGSYAENFAKENNIPYKLLDAPKAGWKKDLTGWWFDNGDGTYPKSTWKNIDGIWYYFNSSGYMATGWLQDGNKWYYLESNGKMATNWKQISGSWYYFESSGAMASGKWVNSIYYMKANGVMATNEWIDGGRYYVDANGKWVANKTKASWKKDTKGWWYDNGDGTYPKSTWKSIDGIWYYFNSSGYMLTGWLNDGGKWYYLESNGKMAANKWVEGKYYMKSNGVMATDEWIDGMYYVKSNGVMATNELIDMFYVGADGKIEYMVIY